MFTPLSKQEEISLIRTARDTGDFSAVFEYLDPLVVKILSQYIHTDSEFQDVYDTLPIPLEDIVSRYLEQERDYSFSAYFSMCVKEVIETYLDK